MTCVTTHLTSFSIREATAAAGGVAFSIAGDYLTFLFPLLVSIAIIIIAIIALVFDFYGKKGGGDKFPHRTHNGRFRGCLTIYRYSLYYNAPFVNIFAYFSYIVWGIYKTLWLALLLWLMLIIEVSVFKENVGSSSITTMIVTALCCGILLIPNSFTHWILVKKRRVRPRFDAQASDRSLKHVVPDVSLPVQVDIMSDREIKFFDKKKQGKPELGNVPEEKPTRRSQGPSVIEDEILSLVGLFLLVFLTGIIWVTGYVIAHIFGDDINQRNGDHFIRLIGCFLLSIFFGIIYSFLKVALASCCVSAYRKRANPRANRCRICFFVDLLSIIIFDDFDANIVKDPKKLNNRIDVARKGSAGRENPLKTSTNALKSRPVDVSASRIDRPAAGARSGRAGSKPKPSSRVDLSARV